MKIFKLEQNYRSCERILKAANILIANNPHEYDKALFSELGYGVPLKVLPTRNEEDEAEKVVAEIISHRFLNRSQYRDYAILYRGNHQARVFEKALMTNRIPYKISGGTSFFSRSEIKDIMAYLRTVSLQQVEGPRGFQYLKDDLQERVDLRSEGRVSKVMFRTLVIE